MFVTELGVPEEPTVDESKEQKIPGTKFTNPYVCLLYYFLNLIFSPYPIYSLVQDKKHDPYGDV